MRIITIASLKESNLYVKFTLTHIFNYYHSPRSVIVMIPEMKNYSVYLMKMPFFLVDNLSKKWNHRIENDILLVSYEGTTRDDSSLLSSYLGNMYGASRLK